MRPGIMEQIPTVLPPGKCVLLLGPNNNPGNRTLSAQIHKLNRSGEWIRWEFRTDLSRKLVTDKVGVVLTMGGVKMGTLTNIRNASSSLRIPCPNQALTIGEAKDILEVLAQGREDVKESRTTDRPDEPIAAPVKNGVPAESPAMEETMHLDAVSEVQIDTAITPEVQIVAADSPEEVRDGPPENQDEVEEAISTLQSFGSYVEESQLAAMLVAERFQSAVAECTALRGKLEAARAELVQLRGDLEASQRAIEEKNVLAQENVELRGELGRLQQVFDGVDAAIRNARVK